MSNILHLLELQQLFRLRIKESTVKSSIDSDEVYTVVEFSKSDWLDAARKVYGPLTDQDLDVMSYWMVHYEDKVQDFDAEVLHSALIAATQVQKEWLQNVYIVIWTSQGSRAISVTTQDGVWRQRLFCAGKTVSDEEAPLKDVLAALQ